MKQIDYTAEELRVTKKAKELVDRFWDMLYEENSKVIMVELSTQAKKCALICVDEIMLEGCTQYGIYVVDHGREKFWQEVKKEINSL